jgi:Erythromycin esterase/Phosphoribosyl transferase domain
MTEQLSVIAGTLDVPCPVCSKSTRTVTTSSSWRSRAAGLGLEAEIIRRVAEREGRELARREQLYREGRPIADPAGRTTIVVDDGLATGSSMRAAILALRRMKPARMVVAVPAAPASTCEELELEVDEVVCATTPSPFFAVGRSYWDFAQTTDEEVRDLLRAAAGRRLGARGRDLPSPARVIRRAAMPVREGVPSEETLFDLVGDARLVLIGEASHGTHDFYAARAAMTRRLIEQRGFRGVAVEADWPDAYRVNRYVRGRGEDATAEESMRDFQRFPTWMWRNTAVLDFIGWLREHNDRARDDMDKTGFYGTDLYSLHRARWSSNWSRCSGTRPSTRDGRGSSPRTSCSTPRATR